MRGASAWSWVGLRRAGLAGQWSTSLSSVALVTDQPACPPACLPACLSVMAVNELVLCHQGDPGSEATEHPLRVMHSALVTLQNSHVITVLNTFFVLVQTPYRYNRLTSHCLLVLIHIQMISFMPKQTTPTDNASINWGQIFLCFSYDETKMSQLCKAALDHLQ